MDKEVKSYIDEKFRDLEKSLDGRLNEIENWMRAKKQQQISQPLDEASKTIINQVTS